MSSFPRLVLPALALGLLTPVLVVLGGSGAGPAPTTYAAGSAISLASASTSSPSDPSDPGGPVVRATRLLRSVGPVTGVPGASGISARRSTAGGADATLALRDVFAARPTLRGPDDDVADGLLARPTQGRRDPFRNGYSTSSVRRCAGHFCVHWVRSTSDRASDGWAATTLRTMNRVWALEVDRLGYDAPPRDASRGGGPRFDVYLSDLGARGLYGYCAPERRVPGQPRAASGFCVLDNDFSRTQFAATPVESLRVTAAHEFFHAVQFGYDYREDPWLLETTAVWMEERFADAVDDNRSYLRYGQVARPGTSLDRFSAQGFDQYGNWPFWEYLSERFGPGVVRRVWNVTARPGVHSAQALRRGLAVHGGLTRLFADYASGNLVPGRTYAEGDQGWPSARPAASRRVGPRGAPVRWTARVDHLASQSLRLASRGVADGRTLRIRVDGPRRATSPAAALVVVRPDGRLVRRAIPLDADGVGMTTVGFGSRVTRSAYVTVANVSTRYRCGQQTAFACEGRPLDQAARFTVTARLLGR